jgi:hypothetical protein
MHAQLRQQTCRSLSPPLQLRARVLVRAGLEQRMLQRRFDPWLDVRQWTLRRGALEYSNRIPRCAEFEPRIEIDVQEDDNVTV